MSASSTPGGGRPRQVAHTTCGRGTRIDCSTTTGCEGDRLTHQPVVLAQGDRVPRPQAANGGRTRRRDPPRQADPAAVLAAPLTSTTSTSRPSPGRHAQFPPTCRCRSLQRGPRPPCRDGPDSLRWTSAEKDPTTGGRRSHRVPNRRARPGWRRRPRPRAERQQGRAARSHSEAGGRQDPPPPGGSHHGRLKTENAALNHARSKVGRMAKRGLADGGSYLRMPRVKRFD